MTTENSTGNSSREPAIGNRGPEIYRRDLRLAASTAVAVGMAVSPEIRTALLPKNAMRVLKLS
jgi:hypothetical protein